MPHAYVHVPRLCTCASVCACAYVQRSHAREEPWASDNDHAITCRFFWCTTQRLLGLAATGMRHTHGWCVRRHSRPVHACLGACIRVLTHVPAAHLVRASRWGRPAGLTLRTASISNTTIARAGACSRRSVHQSTCLLSMDRCCASPRQNDCASSIAGRRSSSGVDGWYHRQAATAVAQHLMVGASRMEGRQLSIGAIA